MSFTSTSWGCGGPIHPCDCVFCPAPPKQRSGLSFLLGTLRERNERTAFLPPEGEKLTRAGRFCGVAPRRTQYSASSLAVSRETDQRRECRVFAYAALPIRRAPCPSSPAPCMLRERRSSQRYPQHCPPQPYPLSKENFGVPRTGKTTVLRQLWYVSKSARSAA